MHFMSEQLSMYDEMKQDPVKSQQLAAAEFENSLVHVMEVAVKESGMTVAEVAAKMCVTEQRLDEILDMQNVNFFTFSQLMDALGYGVEMRVSLDRNLVVTTGII